jgi:DNA processing protein
MMVFRATSAVPLHVDEIASRTGLSMSTVAPSLLTLALENVVVEGPAGFFRRHKS